MDDGPQQRVGKAEPRRPPSRRGFSVALPQLLLLCACSANGSVAGARQALDVAPISGARLKAHMTVLAADDMEGRETGTPGFDRAAAYVAEQLRLSGLTPGAAQWRQELFIRRTRVDEAGTALTLQLGREAWALKYGEDYVTYGVQRDEVQTLVDAALVYAGDGVSVPSQGLNPYQHLEMRDKIVIVIAGAPTTLSEGERSFFGDATQKATTAAAHGARALLLFDNPQIPWELRVRAARQLGTSDTQPPTTSSANAIPVVYLHQRFAERLGTGASAASRPIGPRENSRATLRLRQQSREVQSANVVALLPGRDPRVAREHVVVVAHCDHVGVGEPSRGDAIYNGAVDNASGVAALLEIAREFAARPLARSMVFLCTTGEEQGLIGARYFVAQRHRLPGSIVAAINIDGTSIHPFTALDIRGGLNSSLGAVAEEAGRRTGIAVRHESLGVGGSDHSPFLMAGIPPLWIGATLPDDWMRMRYHTPHDDMQQPIDFDAVAAYTRFVWTLAMLVADAPTQPVWRKGEFFSQPRQ